MDKNNDLTELQKKHQQQMKEKRDAVKQRKARTHRLIVRGAIAEKVIPNAESMTDEQFQAALYQAVGKGNVDKRVDVIATMITMNGTLDDLKEFTTASLLTRTTNDVNQVQNATMMILSPAFRSTQISPLTYLPLGARTSLPLLSL